jgi:hypothetical protein
MTLFAIFAHHQRPGACGLWRTEDYSQRRARRNAYKSFHHTSPFSEVRSELLRWILFSPSSPASFLTHKRLSRV